MNKNEIRCPHCGKVFQVDESGYEALVRQVRDEQFAADLHERVEALEREQTAALELERAAAASERQRDVAARDARIAELTARAEALERAQELAAQKAVAEARAEEQAAAAEAQRAVEQAAAEQVRELEQKLAEAARGAAAQQHTAEQAAAEARHAAEAELAEQKRAADLALAAAQQASVQDLAALQRQVDQLQAQLASKADAVKLAEAAAREQGQEALAARDARITELSAQVEGAARERALAVAAAEARAREEVRQVSAEQERQLREQAASEQDAVRRQAAAAQAELTEAVATAERERDQARMELSSAQTVAASKEEQLKSAYELELAQARRTSDELIRYKDEEIERLRDMKARLSTKMLGETLEQHCETEFNRIRTTAFPRAYFEKDNESVKGEGEAVGTKGDYVFREVDEDGVEILSIMFEMKNEDDATAGKKKKNEDHFKKLDADRNKKGCEYAVLVTLLEPESELYNTGIVDVSWRYPKMYVIRPQFFIPLITLLRNAALNAVSYKRQLAEARRQDVDVTGFEDKLGEFQRGFARNYESASKNFNEAIDEIDKAIARLNATKQKLLTTGNQLRLANDKAQGLTIRKLTYKNPTMQEAFREAREAKAAFEGGVEVVDAAGAPDGDFEEPEYEVPEEKGE